MQHGPADGPILTSLRVPSALSALATAAFLTLSHLSIPDWGTRSCMHASTKSPHAATKKPAYRN